MKYILSILYFIFLVSFVQAQGRRIRVAQDGSGDYRTVQAALDAVPLHNKKPITITIAPGTYREKLQLDSTKDLVRLEGADAFTTILVFDDHTGKLSPRGDTINTYTSQSFMMAAHDFTARNLSFVNDAGFNAGQAVAIQVRGDRAAFFHCRFVGNQDVLFPSQARTRQYFYGCYIEGTTDFIFGPSTAWFEQCHIHSKKNSHVTAASTPQETAYGFVFHDCVLTADSSLHGVSLGRPWRPYASVTYLHCYIDRHILPAGWNNWKDPANERTARFSEYHSYGPGANPSGRFPWSHQLSDAEAARFTLKKVLGGWMPHL